MSNVQQQVRESFNRGDTVEVVTPYGNGQIKHERVQLATVVETLRSAVRCRFPDGAERAIQFKHVRKPAPAPAAAPAPVVERRGLRPALVTPAPPMPQPAEPTRPLEPLVPPVIAHLADVEAWLQMGRTLLDPLDTKIADLRQHKEGLDAERVAIERELDLLTDELRTLHAQREQVAKLTGQGLPERKDK